MKILLVDDDELAAEMSAAVLEDNGHEIVLAGNGFEALEKLAAEPGIAFIVSDMNMPMMSGIELFQELRAQGETRPFMLLTGDEPDALLAREPGLDACLLKDFSLEESLPQKIAEVLARRGHA